MVEIIRGLLRNERLAFSGQDWVFLQARSLTAMESKAKLERRASDLDVWGIIGCRRSIAKG